MTMKLEQDLVPMVQDNGERSKWLEGGVNSLFKISTNFTKQVS